MTKRTAVKNAAPPARKRRGFSLVEVLVAMLILSFMLFSIMQLFVMSSYTGRLVEEQTRLSGFMETVLQRLQQLHLDNQGAVVPAPLALVSTPTEAQINAAAQGDPALYRTYVKGLINSDHGIVIMPIVEAGGLGGQNVAAYSVLGTPDFTGGVNSKTEAQQALDDGSAMVAVAYWFVESMQGGQARRVTVHVDSGYRMAQMSILRQAKLTYTSIFPPQEWY
jgi:prepilin-type N-terminal cleavage/methylation domain-containing protein